jgi:AcrR family transcriptional regulator
MENRVASTRRHKPGRRALQSERSRQDIVEAALRTIASVGFRDASIDAIAAAADISAASIYWHFGNREGLFVTLAREITDLYVRAVAADWAACGATSPEAIVRSYLRSMTRFAVERPDVIRAHIALSTEGVTLPTLLDSIRAHNREARRPVLEAVDAGVSRGVFRPVLPGVWVDFVVGSILGAAIFTPLHREGFDPHALLAAVHDAALALLGLPADHS